MVEYIKEICLQAIETLTFSDFVFGEVISENPISVKISDKLILNESQLIFSKNVTDFVFEQTREPLFPNDISLDNEDFKKREKVIVYNHLKAGEKVVLIKAFGGQLYFIVDRVLGVNI